MTHLLRKVVITVSVVALIAMPAYVATASSRATQPCKQLGFAGNAWQAVTAAPKAQLEQYTSSAVTTSRGVLTLTAQKQNGSWTSGHVSTRNTCAYTYGMYTARILTPVGAGLWPAFWFESPDDSYELDIVEQIGQRSNITYGHAFAPSCADRAQRNRGCHGDDVQISSPTPLAGQWHTYGIVWAPSYVQWTVDGVAYATRLVHIQGPLYLNLNLAVGGVWAQNPNPTLSTAQMRVAWVHADPSYPSTATAITAQSSATISSQLLALIHGLSF